MFLMLSAILMSACGVTTLLAISSFFVPKTARIDARRR